MAKAEPSNKTKSTASSLKSGVNPKSSPADSQLNNPKEILGAIYGLMVKNREQTIRTRELEQNLQESKKKQEMTQELSLPRPQSQPQISGTNAHLSPARPVNLYIYKASLSLSLFYNFLFVS
jgi:hypothetical protein